MPKRTMTSRLIGAAMPSTLDSALDVMLDHALKLQHEVVVGYVDRLRQRSDSTPAAVQARVEKQYLASVSGIGALSGGVAAVPGLGTTANVATVLAEVAAFVEATALFTLAVAEIHGYRFDDLEVRRALVLGVIMGDIGAGAVETSALAGARWAPLLARGVNREARAGVNHQVVRRFATHFGTRQGVLALGRALPFGVGAGVGASGNYLLGRSSVRAARRAFGPPPPTFGPRIIEG